jgi:hypothetical protein
VEDVYEEHPMNLLVLLLALSAAVPAAAQTPTAPQTEEDDYTRYDLLGPDTQQFAIVYDVTATTAGARYYFNPIRRGSEATDERVIDLMTGEALEFDVVAGPEARQGGHPAADADTSYIRIHLPRPVPKDGEVRLRIWKTYKDPKSYYRKGDLIVFDRSLGIRRNAVVLPRGYELVSCNVPSQVLSEADGRVKISFLNTSAAAAPLVVRARAARTPAPAPAKPPSAVASRLSERAFQDREIVYFLQSPETHAFSLYHDYTETREGVDKYINVVRGGSTVSNPSARLLDTGDTLKTEILKGSAITAAKIDIGEAVKPETEIVVIHFPPVKKGQSVRLRIAETYTDPERYRVDGDLLVWDRSFGRPRNTVVLPAGWSLVDSAVPAAVTETDDGRVRLFFENNRTDDIATLVRARRRQ